MLSNAVAVSNAESVINIARRKLKSRALRAVFSDDANALVDAFALSTAAAPTAVLGLTFVAKMILQAAKRCAHACVKCLMPHLRHALQVCGSTSVAEDVQLLLCNALHRVSALGTPCALFNDEFTADQHAAHDARMYAMVSYLVDHQYVDLEAANTRDHLVCYGECVQVSSLPDPTVVVTAVTADDDADGSDGDSDDQSNSDDDDAKKAERRHRRTLPPPTRELLRFHRLFKAGAKLHDCTPLSTAIEAANLPAVKALIAVGANVEHRYNADQLSLPLQRALIKVHRSTIYGGPREANAVAIVGVLLDHNADVSAALGSLAAGSPPNAVSLGAAHPSVQPALFAALTWPSSRRRGWIVACVQLGLLADLEDDSAAVPVSSSVKRARI